MPRLTPLHWKVLECIFLKDGFTYERQVGSHRTYSKKGVARPLVLPTYKEVQVDIIRGLMRTADMSREKFFELLKECN